jgi:hypothetical protein
MKRLFVVMSLFLSSCVLQRSVVQQPELSLLVLDQDQQPLPNAKVGLHWWSNPYSRLQESQLFSTNSQGQLMLPETLQADTAFPLMLHGVQEFHHGLCIEAIGYQTLIITLTVLPKDSIIIRASLNAGESVSICDSFDRLSNHPGNSRLDITAQHPSIQAAYEVPGE